LGQGGIPQITQQPVSQAVVPGSYVSLDVAMRLDDLDRTALLKLVSEGNTSFYFNGVPIKTSSPPWRDHTVLIPPVKRGTDEIHLVRSFVGFEAAMAGSYTFQVKDERGHIFVVDCGSDSVRILSTEGKTGTRTTSGAALNPAFRAANGSVFNDPRGIV